jgi:hypothetical protein
MAKYENPFEDTLEIFEGVIKKAELNAHVTIKVLTDNSLKKVVAKAVRANDLVKYETKNDVYIFVNENIFEQLTEEQQVMAADEVIAGIHYDMDKDKLIITQEDIKTFSGVLSKYGYDNYEVLQESIRTLFSVEKNGAEV